MSLNQLIDDGNCRKWLDVRFDNVAACGNFVLGGSPSDPVEGNAIEVHGAGADGADSRISSFRHGDNTDGAELQLSKSRGTQSTPTPPDAGDKLAVVRAHGWTDFAVVPDSTYVQASEINFVANENFLEGATGSRIDFGTTTDGTTGSFIRMQLTDVGDLSLNHSLRMQTSHVGDATLVDDAGAAIVVVPSLTVKNNSRIFLSYKGTPIAAGDLYIKDIAAGASFRIQSTNNADRSVVSYFVVDQGA